jgi:hypothetical protein
MAAFTLKEAADELRISLRRFQDIVKRYPFYYPNGIRKLFTEENLASIRSALAEEQRCLNSNDGTVHRTNIYAGPSGASAYSKALELISASRKPRRKQNAARKGVT